MALAIKTDPATEPVTLAEAKTHLRVTTTDDDAYITNLVAAARQKIESDTGRALITQTWYLYLDEFPPNVISIPLPRLQSVTAITYNDNNGETQTWAANKYQVDAATEPARVQPIMTEYFPATYPQLNAVRVEFVCGYGNASAVPLALKQALLLLLTHWYENREILDFEGRATTVPHGYDALVWQHRGRFDR